jgi:hypothetical protein
MKQDYEKLKNHSVKEIIEQDKRNAAKRKKIMFFITAFIIFIFISIKLSIGIINIALPISYSKNRSYDVTINNISVLTGFIGEKTISIIPSLVNVQLFSNNISYVGDYSVTHNFNQGVNISIGINSYECFVDVGKTETQIDCANENSKTVKNNVDDTIYYLYIKDADSKDKIIYDGLLISDITNYLMDPGLYYIEILGKYKNVNNRIYFWIKVNK